MNSLPTSPPYNTRGVQNNYKSQVIATNVQVRWSARLPDLTVLNFIWRYVKERVYYETVPANIEIIEERLNKLKYVFNKEQQIY